MQNDGTWHQGYTAAKAGKPSSANPFPKPEKLPRGEAYPGDWYSWLSGWCAFSEIRSRDTSTERAAMYRMTLEALK